MRDELVRIQNRLVEGQVELVKLIENIELESLELEPIEYTPKLEVIEGVLKITIPEYPPKVSIFDRAEVVNGSISSKVYQKARNRWYSLIHKALKDYKGERIDPAIVYIVYYVPRICDVSNFIGKIIVDGLMYAKAIAKDDNLEKVPVLIQEARIDKEDPRTEIFVIKYENQIEKNLTPWEIKKDE